MRFENDGTKKQWQLIKERWKEEKEQQRQSDSKWKQTETEQKKERWWWETLICIARERIRRVENSPQTAQNHRKRTRKTRKAREGKPTTSLAIAHRANVADSGQIWTKQRKRERSRREEARHWKREGGIYSIQGRKANHVHENERMPIIQKRANEWKG